MSEVTQQVMGSILYIPIIILSIAAFLGVLGSLEKGEDNRSPAGLALYVALPDCSDTASQIATST